MMRPSAGARPLPPSLETARDPARRSSGPLGRSQVLALSALVFILGVTAVWWAVALWPISQSAPAWLQTARAVCFGAHEDGLPSAGGWILLVGEPIGMITALYIVWREPLLSGLGELRRNGVGRAAMALAALVLMSGLAAAGWRVTAASSEGAHGMEAYLPAEQPVRLVGTVPSLSLIDQHGETITLERFRGRPVLVTFAYAHCETVCPLLVRDALRAQQELDPSPVVIVVTLDPWRDPPSRLPRIARAWEMGDDAFIVSGEVAAVEQVLRDWNAEGARDPRNGQIVHGPLTYVVAPRGELALATSGRAEELIRAVHQLR